MTSLTNLVIQNVKFLFNKYNINSTIQMIIIEFKLKADFVYSVITLFE